MERIHTQGKLVVGMDASFPPFEDVTAAGDLQGFDVDLARAMAQRLGVPLELQNVGIDGLYDALLARKIDAAISALSVSPELTRVIIFSEPYYNAGQWLVVRAGDDGVRGPADLKGRVVGVELGAEGEVQARKFPGAQVRTYETAQAALDDLRAGKLAAVVADAVTVDLDRREKGGIQTIPHPVTVEPFVVAMRRSDGELLKVVNESLAALRADGTLERLRQKWL